MTRHIWVIGILALACNQHAGAAEASKSRAGNAAYSASGKQVAIHTTAQAGPERLTSTGSAAFVPASQAVESDISIFVEPRHRFQTVLGIGGAITDASAEVFAKLPQDKQKELLKAYYDPVNGIGYTLARTTIHSSDFSSASYTYIEEGDKTLSTFSIEHDRAYKIPLLKSAIASAGGRLTLFASPWSPPAFMKDNGSMLQGGKLLPAYRDAWASYYTKFIKAYEKEGIPVWGISVQNEPMATQRWESAIYSAEDERDFLKLHLGPVMKKAGLGEKKIIVWDHNRDLMAQRANTIFDDPEAAKYAWGIGFHWYETWAGGEPMHDNLREVRATHPGKHILLTEAAIERFDPAKYQHWPHGEKYGRSMIQDFNGGSVGWTDWNILLDQQGGPNHVGNFCFSALHADTSTGELIYTPIYYYIGHFSKFIRPGARRVSGTSSRSTLLTTSFLNKDNTMATVVMNDSDKEVRYSLYVGKVKTALLIPAHAIQTLVY